MTVNLNWCVNVRVCGEPQRELNQYLELDWYDSVSVAVPAGDNVTAEVQPGDSEKVHLLIIQSNHYGSDHKYKIVGTKQEIEFDQPQILSGTDALALLAGAPQIPEFTNGLSENAAISIYTDRNSSTS